jgi:uncharacterized protein
MMEYADIFCVPIKEKYLIHAPLHRLTALVNSHAVSQIRDALQHKTPVAGSLSSLVHQLQTPVFPYPSPRDNPELSPLFLGLIPTRGCNMGCHYCDFAAPKQDSPVMSLEMARNAIDAYFHLLSESGNRHAEVHFFGGEPFFADRVIHFAVEYARWRADQNQFSVRFEVTSNGLYNTNRCQWIADHFDTIILSLDGMPDIQDRHRPGINGRSTADIIVRNAKIFSDNSIELVIRVCVTSETVERLPEIAHWIAQEFRPSTVCVETLSLSHNAEVINFTPPDPLIFAHCFDAAAHILRQAGIETVISTADTSNPRSSFCPVGKDALIVTPDGAVNACYLLEKDWVNRGLDLQLGKIDGQRFMLADEAVTRARHLTVDHRSLCSNCLCRFYCAGGCHVNHYTEVPAGQYDDQCIQTRAITFTRLLRGMGQDDLADQWLNSTVEIKESVMQKNDHLVAIGGLL